mgnify:FL=1
MNLFVGTDIESVDRFKKIIDHNIKDLHHFFFKSEYEYAINKVNREQSFAGIWCAKEAVVKSFNKIRKISIRDVEVICQKDSAPEILIRNFSNKGLAFSISVSISHTTEYATAVCVLQIL